MDLMQIANQAKTANDVLVISIDDFSEIFPFMAGDSDESAASEETSQVRQALKLARTDSTTVLPPTDSLPHYSVRSAPSTHSLCYSTTLKLTLLSLTDSAPLISPLTLRPPTR